MAAYTVAELCKMFDITSVTLNGYVRNKGLPLVSDNPRRIDDKVLADFIRERKHGRPAKPDTTTRKLGGSIVAGIAEGKVEEIITPITDAEQIPDNQLLLWDKRTGKGWNVGVTQETELEDDYVAVLSANAISTPRPAMLSSLLTELKKGKLYLVNPAAVLAILAIQLERAGITDAAEDCKKLMEKLTCMQQ